ncbi:hypothetical protein [Pseudacidovorax intermedius]|uniref:hypothetical protein n=1 Tax=Pseudacidovorax intermedius TaxID=433924 RepID=UPI0011C0717A|nr:hypothetical protein [Pseudacidovorax intermedius]
MGKKQEEVAGGTEREHARPPEGRRNKALPAHRQARKPRAATAATLSDGGSILGAAGATPPAGPSSPRILKGG